MNFILQLPRLWLEIIAVFTMVSVVMITIIFSNEISTVIPMLAVLVQLLLELFLQQTEF